MCNNLRVSQSLDPRTQEGVHAFERGDVEFAMALWHQAAEDGDSEALRHLGVEARDAGDAAEAMRFFTIACELGNGRAFEQLGGLHYVAGEVDEALRLWRIGTSLGDPHSMTLVAMMAEELGGNEQDLAWFERASALGHAGASERLAVRAVNAGESPAERERLWRIAADQGSFTGCAVLASIADVQTGGEERIYWADRALACQPSLNDDADVQRARVLGIKGSALLVLGRLDEALPVFVECRATAPIAELDVDQLIADLRMFLSHGIPPAGDQSASSVPIVNSSSNARPKVFDPAPSTSKKQFCANCGQQRIEQARFCIACGSGL